jgi:threonine 3-dehydrogenase
VMIESGLNIAPVITHRLDYRDFQQGFDAMNTGSASKVILNWE